MEQRYWLNCYNKAKINIARYEAVGYKNALDFAHYLMSQDKDIKEVKLNAQFKSVKKPA